MKPSNDADTLHRQRHRLTPQRLIVLEVIKRSGKHLTAQEIHAAVLPHQPYVNIATVYRTLQWLQDVGLVAPIAVGSGAVRYEYTSGAVHHHLICQECGQEQEIGDDILDVHVPVREDDTVVVNELLRTARPRSTSGKCGT